MCDPSNPIFKIFYVIFGAVLKFCCAITANYYILALFVFTLIIHVVLFPFAIKQHKSSVKMAKLSPKVMLIKEKYKGRNDRVTQQKMNTEIQDLYQKEGYNPYSGCLPLLLQLPIIIILWGVINMPLSYTTSTDVKVDSQYEMAVKILDGAVGAIEESGLLADTNSDEISGEVSDTSPDGSLAENSGENLSENPASDTSLVVSGDNSLDDASDTLKGFVETYTKAMEGLGAKLNGNRWNKEAITRNQKYEFTLTRFILEDYRTKIIDELKKAGVDEEIIYKNIPDELVFNENFVKSIPNFDFIGNTSLLDTPSGKRLSILWLIPVLVFISSFFGGVITKKVSSPPQLVEGPQPGGGFMKWGLPLFSAWLSYTLPVAVGIYWIYRTVFGIGQSFILAKMYPIPKISEEEMAELKKQLKAKKKKVITIEVDEDDESFDNLIIKTDKKDSPKTKYEMLSADDDQPKSKIERAPLKEEKDNNDASDDDTDED